MLKIKKLLPPIILEYLRGRRFLGQISFQGDYCSWTAAKEKSKGYDDEIILDKVRNAVIKVKNGDAAFERDSVAFDGSEYRWPLLSSLLYVANLKQRLYVLDFGGSLGSLYFQHKKWLQSVDDFFWGIVEQPHFVKAGKREFSIGDLDFFFNVKEFVEQKHVPDVIVLSSVLQYLEKPFQMLEEITAIDPGFLLVDRTAFIAKDKHRLTIQHIPASIYKASYPAWFFSEKQFVERVESMGYEVFDEFSCDDHVNNWSYFKGFLFKKNEKAA
jgi:putative methyltransferase (TIGR04325 family)